VFRRKHSATNPKRDTSSGTICVALNSCLSCLSLRQRSRQRPVYQKVDGPLDVEKPLSSFLSAFDHRRFGEQTASYFSGNADFTQARWSKPTRRASSS